MESLRSGFRIFRTAFVLLLAVSCSDLRRPAVKTYMDEEDAAEEFRSGDRLLPVVFVTTKRGKGITDRDNWLESTVTVVTQDRTITLNPSGKTQVRGRGNASWAFPKKAFDVKFDKEESLLGMTEGSRWCALANWRDITLLRNAVALEIARMTSLDWTPEGSFADVVVDGKYQGNYYFTQKVEIGPGSVDVGEDGILFCHDEYFDKDFRFRSKLRDLPVNVILYSGCALDAEGFSALKSYVSDIEYALYKGRGDWRQYLDEDSFCDWLIVHELTGNNEPTRPHSVYMHKRAEGLLYAGPAWDFDCRTFRPGITGLVDAKAVWYDALLSDRQFVLKLKERWNALRPSFETRIPDFIDYTYGIIRWSAERNAKMWPINTTFFSANGDEKLSYDDAVSRLRSAYLERIRNLDNAVSGL